METAQHTEGTLVLDGLIEGRIPSDDGKEKLRKWVEFAEKAKLGFHLETDGPSFNILADNRPMRAAMLGPDRTETISQALRELLKIFSPAERARVFSTLRSVEYKRDQEIQTLYVVAPDGTVATRDRSVEAKTAPPPPPLTRKEKVRLGAYAVVTLLAVFGISSIFIPWRSLFTNMRDEVTGYDVVKLNVDATAFADYFTLEKKGLGGGGRELVVVLKRTGRFPVTDADYDVAAGATTAPASRPVTLVNRLALEAIKKGYVQVEYFGEDGQYRLSEPLRIRDLQEKESLTVSILLPLKFRAARLVLTY